MQRNWFFLKGIILIIAFALPVWADDSATPSAEATPQNAADSAAQKVQQGVENFVQNATTTVQEALQPHAAEETQNTQPQQGQPSGQEHNDQNQQPAQQNAENQPNQQQPNQDNAEFQPQNPPPVTESRYNRKYAIITFVYDGQPLGKMKFKLEWEKMYASVSHFIGLARGTKAFTDKTTGKMVTRPFYDNLTIHRIVRGFVFQGGCPFGNGRGNHGSVIPDEWHPNLHHNKPGVLALAKQLDDNNKVIPNSTGSQFYVTFSPQPQLDKDYAIIGSIQDGDSESKKTLDLINKLPTDFYQHPIEALTIDSITILEQ